MGCLKRLVGRLRPAWTRSRATPRPLQIGSPTDFRKEANPLSTIVDLSEEQESLMREKGIAEVVPICYRSSRMERVGNSVWAHARKVSANLKAAEEEDP